jgi:aminopeptidase-like protein
MSQTHEVGAWMHALVCELFPICRSITGDGVRATLRRVGCEIPLIAHEVPTGTPVLDWTVPREWNIRDAYVADAHGERVIDFRRSNLHVVNYSVPICQRMSLRELRPHLHTLPQQPDWVPYRTSYYADDWGFCLSQRHLESLADGDYDVVIDATLEAGHLTYGECLLPGTSEEEVLISCHCCHPALANDNLSGIAVATAMARHVQAVQHRYSYRFLFIPGTIGSIAWLSRNEESVSRVRHGVVLSGLGDRGHLTYKKSRRGDAAIDRAARHVLAQSRAPYEVVDFTPYGYDERQYCSPGFDLPIGCMMRTPNGQYPEYHSSADDCAFVTPERLADSYGKLIAILDVLEGGAETRFVNTHPKGEPQLGRRGLYGMTGGASHPSDIEMALLWVLNYSDGAHSLLDIAERAQTDFAIVRRAADSLREAGLLAQAP